MPLIDVFAYSFAHAIVKVDGRQFTGVRSVSVNQELQESAVFGTEMRPIGRSVGQLQLGRGQLVFSDYGEGTDFFAFLGDQPFLRLWALDYTLVREEGSTRTIECLSCRLTGAGIEHEAGPDALGITFPFSFLAMRVDGTDLAISPKSIAQTLVNVGQAVANLL